MITIDMQGSELDVLMGAETVLQDVEFTIGPNELASGVIWPNNETHKNGNEEDA